MDTLLFRIPKIHEELFGDDRPRSFYLIVAKVFDIWHMHPLRGELTHIFAYASKEKQEAFIKEYVEEIPLEGLIGIAPGWHFDGPVHKSWRLAQYLERDGKINMPLMIWYGLPSDSWEAGYIHEGHHRAGAAAKIGWKTVPAFVLNVVDRINGERGMSAEDREEFGKEQEARGLPNSSRMHATRLCFWSEMELRQFMYPRPDAPGKYYVRDMSTANCVGEDPRWDGVPYGVEVLPWGRLPLTL